MYVPLLLLVFLWWAIHSRYTAISHRPKLPRVPAYAAPVAALTSSAVLIIQLASSRYASALQSNSCLFHAPIPTVDVGSPGGNVFWQGVVPAAIAFAQSGLLLLLYLGIRSSTSNRWIITIALSAVISAAATVVVPVMTSVDPYAYITYADLGFASYADAFQHVNVPHLPLSAWCVTVMIPNLYGPLFVAYVKLLVAGTANPAHAVLLLRLTNVVWLAAALVAMRLARAPAHAIALTATNPTFLLQYVSTPHNDVIAIALLMIALAAARRSIVAAFVCVVLTGLIKLPLAVVGAVAFTSIEGVWKRVALAFAAIVAAVAIGSWWAGPYYLATTKEDAALLAPYAYPLQSLTAVLGGIAIACALIWRRYSRIGSLVIPTIPVVSMQAWYLGWGLPYAASAGRGLIFFLIALPIASLFADVTVARPAQLGVLGIIAISIIVSLVSDMRQAGT
jgi:hypothetical protein